MTQTQTQIETQKTRLYELLEQAHRHGYNWRGVWDKMSYTSKMLAVEQICEQGTYSTIFYDKEFQKVIFGKMGEIVSGLNESWHLLLSSIGSVVYQTGYKSESSVLQN